MVSKKAIPKVKALLDERSREAVEAIKLTTNLLMDSINSQKQKFDEIDEGFSKSSHNSRKLK